MHGIGHGMFHCPRCGTLQGCYADGSVTVPALVLRCRFFVQAVIGDSDEALHRWRTLGIAEAIDVPQDR